jgi:hypothetical protein
VPGFSFSPNNPHGVFKPGKLSVHTKTSYDVTPANENPGGATQRLQLNVDDDLQFNPDAIPKCATTPSSFQSWDMAEALAHCGPTISNPNAWLWQDTATSNGTATLHAGNAGVIHACVLAFNVQDSASEIVLMLRADVHFPSTINCSNPKTNHQGNASYVVKGDLKPNPAIGTDYADPDKCAAPGARLGCQIDFNNITSTLPVPLEELNFSLKRGNYLRARCVDPPAGNRKWNLRALFTYNGGSPLTTTVFKTQACT